MNDILNLIGSAALAVLVIHWSGAHAAAGVAVSIGQNFTSSRSHNNADPSPSGAASEDYVVGFERTQFFVYSKADGRLLKFMSTVDFWASVGVTLYTNTCGTGPRVVYDPTVQRWFVAAALGDCDSLVEATPLRLAVSETSDPTGLWHGVSLPENAGSANSLEQFVVHLGLDAQGVYVSAVVWPTNADAIDYTGTALWSLPKADLLVIPPIITNRTWFGQLYNGAYGYSINPAICFDGSAGGDVLAPSSDGVDPKTGNPMTTNTLLAFAIQNAGGPGLATLDARQTIRVQPYTEPFDWALQPDGSTNLVDGDASFPANIYRVGDVLLTAQGIQLGARVAVRWYRISATNHALLESGTVTYPDLDFYFPSIAANTNGTVVLAFNGSGSNAFISCYVVVGQTVDGVTTFGMPLLLQAGMASYQSPDPYGHSNWGSYSTTCVDPADPNVFWTINTYATGSTNWATQITQLLTSPSPQLSITNAGANLLISWPVTTVPFQLLSATDLTGAGSWSPVALTTTTNGTTVSVTMPASSTSAFFRLASQ
jgi:hypothetical protein